MSDETWNLTSPKGESIIDDGRTNETQNSENKR